MMTFPTEWAKKMFQTTNQIIINRMNRQMPGLAKHKPFRQIPSSNQAWLGHPELDGVFSRCNSHQMGNCMDLSIAMSEGNKQLTRNHLVIISIQGSYVKLYTFILFPERNQQ
jgi:hypothetical protein